MSDLVKIDRAALLDLIQAVNDLTVIVANSNQQKTIEDLEHENNKLKYVNKLVRTSMESYEKHNQ